MIEKEDIMLKTKQQKEKHKKQNSSVTLKNTQKNKEKSRKFVNKPHNLKKKVQEQSEFCFNEDKHAIIKEFEEGMKNICHFIMKDANVYPFV